MSSEHLKWFVAESRRKAKLRAVAYLGGCCSQCGYAKCVDALDFHHRDPTEKDFRISSGGYRRWESVQRELDKCVLLCANCHREVHAELRRAEAESRKAKVLADKVFRGPSREVGCSICGTPVDVIYSKAERQQNLYCSRRCSGVGKEKAAWPSDEVLREILWQCPATEIAKRLGVSSVAIKKRCQGRGIPTPPRGYWQKLSSPA